MENINNVWVLSTLYENGKFEVNGVFKTQEGAENLKKFMTIHQQDADDGYVIVESKITEYIVMN